MRTLLFLLLSLAFSTTTFAQKGKPKAKKQPVKVDTLVTVDAANAQIKHLTILKNNVKSSSGDLVNGNRESFWKSYHKNGAIASLSEYRKDVLVGVSVDFDERGMREKQVNHQFVNDTVIVQDEQIPALQHYTIYDKAGQLSQTGSMLNKQKTGVWREFSPNGSVSQMTAYQNNEKNGADYIFDEKGGIKEEANYEKGLLSGQKITYVLVGKGKNHTYRPLIEESYKAGKLDGEFTQYHKNGKTQEVSNYRNGVKHGASKWYYETGNILSDFEYNNGALEGKSNTYHNNGKVKTASNYKNSKLNGSYQSYYPDGKLEKEGTYDNGEKDGKWVYYNKEEKVAKTEWYEKGELTKTKE
ncbi:MAG: hypothetical protein R3E32_22660 [Chitinophagales bacterium]